MKVSVKPSFRPRAFTLPAVLVMLAGLFFLVVGWLAWAGVERRVARRVVDRERATLAVRAGLAEVEAVMKSETANDDFLIIGSDESPHLFIARGSVAENGFSFQYRPLFSATRSPESRTALAAPSVEPIEPGVRLQPGRGAAACEVEWLPLTDADGRTSARYAFFVEDLQGRLDPRLVGNADDPKGHATRPEWPFPTSGLNPSPMQLDEQNRDRQPPLAPVALSTLAAEDDAAASLSRKLVENRPHLLSPESVVAAAELPGPLKRDAEGCFENPLARALEENTTTALQPYDEQPRVPFAVGISPEVAGLPKWNLNAWLEGDDMRVSKVSDWIRQGLPEFETRKGGFPEQYVETLVVELLCTFVAVIYFFFTVSFSAAAKILSNSCSC